MLSIQEIYIKYAQEIEITKRRIIDHISILSIPEIEDLKFSLEPRNNCEKAAKEDFMGFCGQRQLEGFSKTEANQIAKICVEKSIQLVKEAKAKEIKKYHKKLEKEERKAKKIERKLNK